MIVGLIGSGFRERDVGGCWVRLGSLVGIAVFVVVVGLIGDRFYTFGVWGLLEIWFWHLLEFHISNFLFVF